MTNYFLIALTLAAAVYSQVIVKWQMSFIDVERLTLMQVILKLVNWWIFSAGVAVIVGAVSWAYVLSRYELSYAYNFIALLFPLMVIAGVVFFGETLRLNFFIGSFLIVLGLIVIQR